MLKKNNESDNDEWIYIGAIELNWKEDYIIIFQLCQIDNILTLHYRVMHRRWTTEEVIHQYFNGKLRKKSDKIIKKITAGYVLTKK